jgi:hypothetical protein
MTRKLRLSLATAIAALVASAVPAASARAPDAGREQRRQEREDRRNERAEARKERAEQRRERRRQRLAALSARFGAALRQPAVRAELELHARRTAKLKALHAVAEREGKVTLLPRIDRLTQKEQARHERRMAALSADAGRAQ